jgi:hypothetical protein
MNSSPIRRRRRRPNRSDVNVVRWATYRHALIKGTDKSSSSSCSHSLRFFIITFSNSVVVERPSTDADVIDGDGGDGDGDVDPDHDVSGGGSGGSRFVRRRMMTTTM